MHPPETPFAARGVHGDRKPAIRPVSLAQRGPVRSNFAFHREQEGRRVREFFIEHAGERGFPLPAESGTGRRVGVEQDQVRPGEHHGHGVKARKLGRVMHRGAVGPVIASHGDENPDRGQREQYRGKDEGQPGETASGEKARRGEEQCRTEDRHPLGSELRHRALR